jgi:hypothetical protein
VKALVDWLLAQRLRTIVVAVVAAPLLPIVASALIALETARRGVTSGMVCGAGALAGLLVLAVLSRTELSLFAAIGIVCAGVGLGIGALIRRAPSLVFAFQAVMLICLTAVGAIALLGIDIRTFFEPAIEEIVAVLKSSDLPAQEIDYIEQRSVAVFLATAVFSQTIGALLLGYWWTLLAAGQRRFAEEFRWLRLGRSLGAVSTLIIGLALVFDWELVQNLWPLALLGFLLQGVAVLHAWGQARGWNPGLMAPLYVLLVLPPFNVLAVLPISIVGFVDSWFDLRASLRSRK